MRPLTENNIKKTTEIGNGALSSLASELFNLKYGILFQTIDLAAQTGQSNVSEPRSPPPIIRAMDRKGTDGWDTEEWGSLEEEPVAQSYSNNSIQELGTGRLQIETGDISLTVIFSAIPFDH
uniref:Uncharacterized protein n=1 Tax=Timema shepardi TaxID=629360 RepID=A0A7R9AVB6_TIMSH|nr:unnamed protein product [Timema shepardi]